MPPTPQHPPPAPDWILGEDGHWRPPPFTAGSGRPRPNPGPGQTPGPGDAGGGRGGRRPSMRRRMGMRRRDVVWGVLGLAVLGTGIFSTVGDGMSLLDRITEGEPTFAEKLAAEEEAQAEDIERIQDDLASGERVVLGPDGDRVCPESEWVGRMTDRTVPAEIVREGVEREVNGVDISGVECRYGEDVRVGKLRGFEERVLVLMASQGPAEMREGPFPGSVRFDDPAAGTATIVFEDEDGVLEAFVTLPLEDDTYLISLSDLTLN